ncbi:MAG: hypothetical protein OSA98_11070 [Rubripirellula sp.]|nr:hypothetical protein [Rubripirellula sp.]
MLTAKVFFLGMLLKTLASELSLPISSASLLLIHAMTPLVLLTATASILSGAISLKRPSQRRKLGNIACVLGLLILGAAILGLVIPLIQYYVNLM